MILSRLMEDAARQVGRSDELRQWVVSSTLGKEETFMQAQRMLAQPTCVGIKIHPEEHIYPIREHGRAIFQFAARYQAVVLAHSGEENSLPSDLVSFANDFPAVRLILAHLGNGQGEHTRQVRAIQQARHGNVWVDTSSGSSLMPRIVEWAVREVGAERILYGSDVPCYGSSQKKCDK